MLDRTDCGFKGAKIDAEESDDMSAGTENEPGVLSLSIDKNSAEKYVYSGSNAYLALARTIPKKSGIVLLPAFSHSAVIEPFRAERWNIKFYDIKIDMAIDNGDLHRQVEASLPDVLVIQDYFGFDTLSNAEETLSIIREKGVVIITDNTHSLFSDFPKIQFDYCQADFGSWTSAVSGGLIQGGDGCNEININPLPADRAVDQFADVYTILPTARENIKTLDTSELSQRRRENYNCLYQGLKENSLFYSIFPECPNNIVPFSFPLYAKKERIRAALQEYLADCNLDFTLIWPGQQPAGGHHTQAAYIYEHLFCIPCDQGFNCHEMQKIVDCINCFSFADHCPDVYYMPNWGEANAERDGGIYACYEFESPNGIIVYPYVKRKINPLIDGRQFYDTLTPYGFNGPVVIQSRDKTALVTEFDQAFSDHCRRENIVAEYVRFSPWLNNQDDFKDCYSLKFRTQTVYVDLSGDFFNAEFTPTLRTNIRKAQKNDIEIRFDFNDGKVGEFLVLFRNMLRKQGAGAYYEYSEAFIRDLFFLMKNNIFQASAIYEGKYVAAALFIFDETNIHYHLSGNDYDYTMMGGHSLLIYEVAKWAKNRNIQALHLGGAYHESLFNYKKKFTRNGFLDFFIGTRIRNQEIYDRLVVICGKNESGYFPEYR